MVCCRWGCRRRCRFWNVDALVGGCWKLCWIVSAVNSSPWLTTGHCPHYDERGLGGRGCVRKLWELAAHWRAAWTRWAAVRGLLNTPPNQPRKEFPGLVGGTEWSVVIDGWLVPCRASVFCPLGRGLAADAFREDRTVLFKVAQRLSLI